MYTDNETVNFHKGNDKNNQAFSYFIKNALPVSRLHKKVLRETRLKIKMYMYTLKEAIPRIKCTKINLQYTFYRTKKKSISTRSLKSVPGPRQSHLGRLLRVDSWWF